MNPVLTQGASDAVDVWMIKVGDTENEARDAPAAIGAHGLRLPASFVGDLPCANCERAALPAEPLAGPGVPPAPQPGRARGSRATSIGALVGGSRTSGRADPARRRARRLSCRSSDPTGCDCSARRGADRRRPEYVLKAAAEFAAFDVAPADARDADLRRRRGAFHRVPDRAGLSAGATRATTRRWSTPTSPRAPRRAGAIMASFDGGIVQSPKRTAAAARCRRCWSSASSGSGRAKPASGRPTRPAHQHLLEGPAARGDRGRRPSEGQREPNLILREGDPRFTATVGCNQILGSYRLESDRLTFGTGADDAMACPPPLGAWEGQLARDARADAVSWRIDGQTLELLDGEGNPLALLQAVYLY